MFGGVYHGRIPQRCDAYVKSVLHALAWLTLRPDEAFAALAAELKTAMELSDLAELRRRFDSVIGGLKIRPYPTPQAIANTYEIATIEFPQAAGLNPLSLWDLHWVKELDDAGFIDDLNIKLSKRSRVLVRHSGERRNPGVRRWSLHVTVASGNGHRPPPV